MFHAVQLLQMIGKCLALRRREYIADVTHQLNQALH